MNLQEQLEFIKSLISDWRENRATSNIKIPDEIPRVSASLAVVRGQLKFLSWAN